MLWKKTSTNYSKWDYFTDSEGEEETEKTPIVPSDDPNFKAMEIDMGKFDILNQSKYKFYLVNTYLEAKIHILTIRYF